MKQLVGHDIGNYVFNPAANQILLVGLPPIRQDQILMVVDTTVGSVLYSFADTTHSGTYNPTTGILTFNVSTGGLNSSDAIQVYVDIPQSQTLSDGIVTTPSASIPGYYNEREVLEMILMELKLISYYLHEMPLMLHNGFGFQGYKEEVNIDFVNNVDKITTQ